MKRSIALLFVIAALAASISIPAISQEPSPSGGKSVEETQARQGTSQKEPDPEKDSAKHSPLIVEQPNTTPLGVKSDGEQEKSKEKAAGYRGLTVESVLTLILSLLTLFVLALQLCILGRQNRIQTGMLKATQDNAIAAIRQVELTETLAVSLEGPRLEIVDAIPDFIFPLPGKSEAEIRFTLYNTGRSTAVLTELRSEILLAPGVLPVPIFSYPNRLRRGRTIVGAGVTTGQFTAGFGREFTKEEAGKILAGEAVVSFYGYATYDDYFGFTHTYEFHLRLDVGPRQELRLVADDTVRNHHTRKKKPTGE